MSENNSIIWKKWNDPLRPLLKNGKGKYEPEEDEEDPEFHKSRNSFIDEDDELPNRHFHGQKSGEVGPVIYGPLGIVPMHESNVPSALYSFWMGHTNFRITRQLANTIKTVDGVETLDIFTPYRFRLGVGQHFKQSEVMNAIDAAVSPKKPVEEIGVKGNPDNIETVKARLSKAFPFWAICTTDGNQLRCLGGKTKDAVETMIQQCRGIVAIQRSWPEEKK